MGESPVVRDVTALLRACSEGDQAAHDQLFPAVYSELHRLAKRSMRGERDGHTLQTTALVNEAYLRLIGAASVKWEDRAHFFALAARIMRRILVDAARHRAYVRHGGGAHRRTLNEALAATLESGPDLVAIDDALERLAKLDHRKSQVIELRFFGGLSVEETAAALRISPQTVLRDWKLAKSWLARELNGDSLHEHPPATRKTTAAPRHA